MSPFSRSAAESAWGSLAAMPRLLVPDDIAQAVANTNPLFSTGADRWTQNCQRCVVAYEMRRRGFDVTAGGAESEHLPALAAKWIDPTTNEPPTWRSDWAAMELEPAGARLQVYVAWTDVDGALSGDAHVFVAEQTVDGLRFVDPQSGTPTWSGSSSAARVCSGSGWIH